MAHHEDEAKNGTGEFINDEEARYKRFCHTNKIIR